MKQLDGFKFTTDKFESGETFWSPDNGKHWHRGLPPSVIVDPSAPKTTVTKVDYERGIIEVVAK